MNENTVNRIVEAVGEKSIPPNVDKVALIRGLKMCAEWHREAVEFRTEKDIKNQDDWLAQTSKTARRLQLLLSNLAEKLPSSENPRAAIERLIETVERMLANREADLKYGGPATVYQNSFKKRSPFEWLVGYWLPMVYIMMNFEDPGDLKRALSNRSPLLRFIKVALAELGISKHGTAYSHASIVKALGAAVKQTVRRKGAASPEDQFQFWRSLLLRQEMFGVSPDQEIKAIPVAEFLASGPWTEMTAEALSAIRFRGSAKTLATKGTPGGGAPRAEMKPK